MKRPIEFERVQPAQTADIQPFQGWGTGITPTQGCTLGCGIQPLRGLRAKTRRNPENGRMAAYQRPCRGRRRRINRSWVRKASALVDRIEVAEWARLMARSLHGLR